MRHQVNANIVHRWLREHESQGLYSESAFLPVTLQLESESSSLTSSSSVDSAPIFSQREPPTIRVEAVWLATEPMDMRAGTDTAFARVIKVFGGAHPHRAAVAPGSVGFRIVIGQSKGESLAPTSVFPIATAPVLKRLGRRDAVNQRIGDGNDAHGVVSKARPQMKKWLKVPSPVILLFIGGADDISRDSSEHVANSFGSGGSEKLRFDEAETSSAELRLAQTSPTWSFRKYAAPTGSADEPSPRT